MVMFDGWPKRKESAFRFYLLFTSKGKPPNLSHLIPMAWRPSFQASLPFNP
jgi:hypothetical protein